MRLALRCCGKTEASSPIAVLLRVLTLCAAVLSASLAEAAYYNEGHSGDSEADAYIIDSLEDFKLMRERVNGNYEEYFGRNKYYKLAADITLDVADWSPDNIYNYVYDGYIRNFMGHFNGQNHTITVNIQRKGNNAALFGAVYRSGTEGIGVIQNLSIAGSVKGEWAAGIALYVYHGTIENCTFTGTVEATLRQQGIITWLTEI